MCVLSENNDEGADTNCVDNASTGIATWKVSLARTRQYDGTDRVLNQLIHDYTDA
jgi:hypothetical protein